MKRSYPSGALKRKKAELQKIELRTLPSVSSYFTPKVESSKPDKNPEILVKQLCDVLECENASDITSPRRQKDPEISGCEEKYSTDPGKWTVIDEDFRNYWILKGPRACQNKDSDFSRSVRCYPETDEKVKKRKLNSDAFCRKLKNGESITREWLIYSPSNGLVYCFVCRLFSNMKSSFSSDGFNDWKHSATRLAEHEKGPEHRACMMNYLCRQKESNSLNSFLSKQFTEERHYWEEVLKRIVAVVKFLACRGLAFRGTNQLLGSQDNGNYLGILELLSEFDPFLKEHILHRGNKGKGVPSYLSANTCEEFIAIMGKKVLSRIIEEIKESKYYSLSIDSTPDICHVDQLTLTVRYMKQNAPVERFLEFVPIHSHKSQYLSEKILNFLEEKNIPLLDCRGQSYDNASNMAGKYAGVQAKLLKVNRNAIFVPCAGHSLNLIGVHAVSSGPDVVRFFEFVQQLYCFFSSSCHRWNILIKHTKLAVKRLSDTRWSARYDAVKALCDCRGNIGTALEDLITDEDQAAEIKLQASHLHQKSCMLETVFLLYLWHDILQRFNSCNKIFQQKDTNLQVVVNMFASLDAFVQQLREQFDHYEAKAKLELPNVDYIDNVKRTIKRSTRIKFYESEESEVIHRGRDKFRIKVFLPIIDSISSEMKKRAEAYEKINNVFDFLTKLNDIDDIILRQKCREFADIYSSDVESEELFLECQQIRHYLKNANVNYRSISDIYSSIKNDGLHSTFPNTEIAMRMYLSMAVTNCTGERSFSKLKLIKSALRNSMTESRLNYLSLLSIENEVTQELDFSDVIKEFAALKSRKENI